MWVVLCCGYQFWFDVVECSNCGVDVDKCLICGFLIRVGSYGNKDMVFGGLDLDDWYCLCVW